MRLLIDVQDRLSRRFPPKRITSCVEIIATQFKGQRGSEQCLQKLKHATCTEDVFTILSTYWSFLEHEMLVPIVKRYGGRKIKRKLTEYRKKLKKFLQNRRMSQFPMPLKCFSDKESIIINKTHKQVIMKLDLKDPSWPDIVTVKERICTILEMDKLVLRIYEVEQGCIKITFYIPNLIAQEIFKERLKAEQIKALTATSVMSLSVTHENVIFNVSYTYMYSCF